MCFVHQCEPEGIRERKRDNIGGIFKEPDGTDTMCEST